MSRLILTICMLSTWHVDFGFTENAKKWQRNSLLLNSLVFYVLEYSIPHKELMGN